MNFLADFFAGAFLCNALPHLAAGLQGVPFPTPFSKPRGVGDSLPLVNFLWGAFNFFIGVLMLSHHPVVVGLHPRFVALVLGTLAIGIHLSRHFGRVRRDKTTSASAKRVGLLHPFPPSCLFLLLGVLPFLFSGCASVSVKKGTEASVPEKPMRIYIQGFETDGGTWNVDRQDEKLTEFKKNLQATLTSSETTEFTKHLVPVAAVETPVSLPPQNAWLITGKFTRVNQGSRLLRAAIGFGTGGTKLETEVSVYDLHDGYPAAQPFLTFATTGGSGAQPGAIGGGVIGAVPNAVGGSIKGLTQDTHRTAREITAMLSQYMYSRGWISQDQYTSPKYKKE